MARRHEAGHPAFEILEHTADIGLRARGKTLEELFENAAAGLLEILGAAAPEGSQEDQVTLEASDPEALLVSFLDELIYLIDGPGARISNVEVRFEAPTRLRAKVTWTPSDEPVEGTELKAATFHQLSLQQREDGYEATVFFDV
jgi:SHS2 domain-containing protein